MTEWLGPLTWPARMERVWDENGVTCDGVFEVVPVETKAALEGQMDDFNAVVAAGDALAEAVERIAATYLMSEQGEADLRRALTHYREATR